MKKLSKLLALSMTAGMLLAACGDTEDVNNDLPDVEETEDPLDPEMEDDTDDDMDMEDDVNDDMDE